MLLSTDLRELLLPFRLSSSPLPLPLQLRLPVSRLIRRSLVTHLACSMQSDINGRSFLPNESL